MFIWKEFYCTQMSECWDSGDRSRAAFWVCVYSFWWCFTPASLTDRSMVNVTSILTGWMRHCVCLCWGRGFFSVCQQLKWCMAEAAFLPPSECQTALHVTWKPDKLVSPGNSRGSLDDHQRHLGCHHGQSHYFGTLKCTKTKSTPKDCKHVMTIPELIQN